MSETVAFWQKTKQNKTNGHGIWRFPCLQDELDCDFLTKLNQYQWPISVARRSGDMTCSNRVILSVLLHILPSQKHRQLVSVWEAEGGVICSFVGPWQRFESLGATGAKCLGATQSLRHPGSSMSTKALARPCQEASREPRVKSQRAKRGRPEPVCGTKRQKLTQLFPVKGGGGGWGGDLNCWSGLWSLVLNMILVI